VSVFSEDGSRIRDAVVVLKTAKREVDRLTFDVDVIERGDVTGGDGRASLFSDRFGFGGFHTGFGRMGDGRAGALLRRSVRVVSLSAVLYNDDTTTRRSQAAA